MIKHTIAMAMGIGLTRHVGTAASTKGDDKEKSMSMHKIASRSQRLMGFFMALLLPAVMAGCADSNGGISPAAPTVTLTTPARAGTEVPINRSITATFSTAMDAATINTTTVKLRAFSGAVEIPGVITLDPTSRIATFNPASDLLPDTPYLATITSDVKDILGARMQTDYHWSFETAPTRDVTAPTVIFTGAYGTTGATSGAIGLPINRASTVAFSEPMNSATISSPATTFTVKETVSGTQVAGVVTYIGISATFTPTSVLNANTRYTSTVATGARDLAGNAIAASYSWTWTTGAAPDHTPPTVTITNPANQAANVPVYKTINATFSEQMKQATMITTNFTVKQTASNQNVPGTVAYDVQNNVAIFMPIANLTPDTNYTATISGGATDVAGNALVAGGVANSWTFRTAATPVPPTVTLTAPARGATGVQIDRSITATFSQAMKSATVVSPATTFTLRAFNSAIPVQGTVTLDGTGNIATFNPGSLLAPNTSYVATISAGVQNSATGTAMAADYNWSFTTAQTPDTTAPAVIATGAYGNSGLTSGATDLPINRASTATFSEAMNPATIASPAASFTVKDAATGNPIAGSATYIGTTATFTPAGLLTPRTRYTSTITTAAKDLAGNGIAADYVWSWTTADAADITAPTVTLTNPANLAINVPVSQTINAKFSEEMKQATIITTNFTVKETATNIDVPGTVAYDVQNNIASFLPTGNLKFSTNYTAAVSNDATDLAGNALKSQTAGAVLNPWTFTTAADAVPVPSPVPLGAAENFGSYGGTAGMTSQGLNTFVDGDIGTTAVSTAVTGFHDRGGNSYTETPLNRGTVNGTIHTYPPAPGNATSMAVADAALAAAQVAYLQLKGMPGGAFAGAGELGLLTLEPGTYTSATTFNITAGNLTLDGKGDPNALFIFQVGQALTVGKAGPAGACSIILVNGAKAKNVFWQVGSSATINGAGGGTMEGTIIAQQAVSFSTAGNAAITTLNGRALSLISGVTMVNTHIYLPAP